MAELTVCCVLRTGGIYDRSHVDRLRDMVKDHLSLPYRFVCVDDSPFPGWWAKISLFEPDRFTGRVLYLDLDVIVVGSLDEIAEYPHPFAAISDYLNPLIINSSVMVWDAGVADHVYSNFTPAVMDRFHGDQNWIYEQMPGAARFPLRWCQSWKISLLFGRIREDARVIVFHGRPKPWDPLPDLTSCRLTSFL